MMEEGLRTRERQRPSSMRGAAFDIALVVVVALFMGGWAFAIGTAHEADTALRFGRRLTVSPFSSNAPPEAAAVTNVVTRALSGYDVYRGHSGAVRVAVVEPGDTAELGLKLPPDVRSAIVAESAAVAVGGDSAEAARDTAGLETPSTTQTRALGGGIWRVLLRAGREIQVIPDFSLITMVPSTRIRSGRIGGYFVGSWPTRADMPSKYRNNPNYRAPRGLIRVTPENRDTPVSEHFTLGDFLTKGQADVWPKYVLMSPRLLDKLELTIQELEREGHPIEHVGVISGFRTPSYNAHGGVTKGRGELSRHMYGDAMDLYIDNDHSGCMDDLDGDGRIGIDDSKLIRAAADSVEKRYPELVGGIGVYAPVPGSHCGFTHIDTRGYRARW